MKVRRADFRKLKKISHIYTVESEIKLMMMIYPMSGLARRIKPHEMWKIYVKIKITIVKSHS